MPRRTLKTVVRDLHEVAVESPSAVTVKIGGTQYVLTGTYIGTIAGEDHGAVIIGDNTYLLELDRRGTLRNAKVLDDPDLDVVTKALLPAPEPPAEVIAAQQMLDALKLPKGFTLAVVNGRIQVVQSDASDDTTVRKPRAPRGTAIPKPKKAPLVKGQLLTRNKDGYSYKVSAIDAENKKVTLEPVKAGEGEQMNVSYPVPVFWKAFSEVA